MEKDVGPNMPTQQQQLEAGSSGCGYIPWGTTMAEPSGTEYSVTRPVSSSAMPTVRVPGSDTPTQGLDLIAKAGGWLSQA